MSVKVAIRVRPFNERQKFLGCVSCVDMKENTTVVYENRGKEKKQHYFTFDYSFWSHDGFEEKEDGLLVPFDQRYIDQTKVYKLLGQEILQNAWVGFNCCLFAYGQTGAGKSYSMIGYGANKGIIPMACEQLFARIARFSKKGQRQYQVTISMLQIYNQKVQDLFLSTNKRPVNGLKIRQNKALGVYVQGLNKFPVHSYKEIERKMQEGSKNRSLASTLMNEYSSRAHTIVMLQFIQKEWITAKKMSKKTSLINLVDLAGSQRVSKTGVGDNKDRLKEASLINKSLHTLGRVIEALAEQSIGKGKSIAIPYRESALTRILQNALGGNSKTTMICAISPANDNCQQTLSTLRYADKTKKIKNKPVVNESQVDKLIRQLRQQNERLKKMLQVSEQENISPGKGKISSQVQIQDRQSKSNVRASMRQIQRQIRKNLQSFAINTDQIIEEQYGEESMMLTDFIDLQAPSQISQFDNSFTLSNGQQSKLQTFITNLNEDQLLNFKVKYSCENNILITNKQTARADKQQKTNDKSVTFGRKVVLCGLGIEENHAQIIKDQNDGKYYIEALSETAAEYTLLNGQPVYKRQELLHNDRIILGTNSVFLFKNINNPQERPNKKYTNEKGVGYQFAINQRSQNLQEDSMIWGSGINSSRIGNRKTSSTCGLKQDYELMKRLEEIQRQYQRMLSQNQRHTKQKQEKYRKQLLELQKQKQLKQLERITLQSKLKEKKNETYRLRSKQLEIQKLQQKLAKYQEEKLKRKKYRESLLLDGLDGDNEGQELENYVQLVGQIKGEKGNQIKAQSETKQGNGKGRNMAVGFEDQKERIMKQNGVGPQYFQQVLLDQYDQKSIDKTLATTQANITNTYSTTLQTEQLNQQTPRDDQKQLTYHNKNMKKQPTTKLFKQELNEEHQLVEQYHRFVENYLLKVKQKMNYFTRLYDITIYPEEINKITNAKKFGQEKTQKQLNKLNVEFACQRLARQDACGQCKRPFDFIDRANTKQKKNKYSHSLTGQLVQSEHFSLNKSNLSDLVGPDSSLRKNSDSQKSKSKSSIFEDETMLLNGTQILSDDASNISRKRFGSVQQDKKNELNAIPEASLEESRYTQNQQEKDNQQKEMDEKRNQRIDLKQKATEKSAQKKYVQQLLGKNSKKSFGQQGQQQLLFHQKSMLNMYISQDSFLQLKNRPQSQILYHSKNFDYFQPSPKPTTSQVEIQADLIPREPNKQQKDEKKPQPRASTITVDFDLSVSDIEQGEHEFSVQQSLNFSSLNTFKEQQLNNQIESLKDKIKQLESQNASMISAKKEVVSDGKKKKYKEEQLQEESPQQLAGKERNKFKKFSYQDRVKEANFDEETYQKEKTEQYQRQSNKKKRLTQLPQTFSKKEFLAKARAKHASIDEQLEKELQSNLIQCNNQNIINERNLQLRKRKKQMQQLKKALFKKQKIQLQKQLFNLIPMVEKFNLMAKQMNRLIEAKIQIQYKNFSHYEIIEALKNFTKSKWAKKDQNYSNVQIRIVVANLEEARIYKWPLEVFRNRFEISEEIFQKFIENNQQGNFAYNNKDIDKSKDPFWDPLDFVPSGVGYLSLECLLYNIDYQGWISFVYNSKVIARAFVCLTPVNVKKRKQPQFSTQQQNQITTIQNQQTSMQIFNPRNFVDSSLYFTITVQTVQFIYPLRQNFSSPIKFQLGYDLLVDDYKVESFTTPETDFKNYDVKHEVNYLRRHCFREVSQSTIAYISDCPIRFTLLLMKDYNEECLNCSFNQDLEKSIDNSSIMDTSNVNLDLSSEISKINNNDQEFKATKNYRTPQKFESKDLKKLDFTKKEKTPIIYQNSQMMNRMEKQCLQEEKKHNQKRKKMQEREAQLKARKEKLKKQEKECIIY